MRIEISANDGIDFTLNLLRGVLERLPPSSLMVLTIEDPATANPALNQLLREQQTILQEITAERFPGKSLRAIGSVLGLSAAAISTYQRGTRLMALKTAEQIIAALQLEEGNAWARRLKAITSSPDCR